MPALIKMSNQYLRRGLPALRYPLVFVLSMIFATVNAQSTSDPLFNSVGSWKQTYPDQWALHVVLQGAEGSDSAWSIENGASTPIIVAVIDTGIDYFHPDLSRRNVWTNTSEKNNGIDDDKNGYIDDILGWNFVDQSNNPWDNAGHGTHVAGVIAASIDNGAGIAGLNRGVRIMSLKVLNILGRGRSSGIAEAIHYAVANGARIINMSLGGAQISELEQRAIDFAFEKNVLVIVASGNDGADTKDFGPAALPNVLTIGAIGPDDKRLGFSNWGASVDLVAPGLDVLSLRARFTDFALIAGTEGYAAGDGFVGSDARYYRATGTSFAAPFVSGVASLMLAKTPSLSAAELMRMLRQSARDIDIPGLDQFTGYGVLDAPAALSIAPDYFMAVSIDGVEVIQKKGKPAIRVLGSVAANDLDKAWIEIGVGEAPEKWKKVSQDIKAPVTNGALDELEVKHFSSARQWTLRLIGRHKDGRKREARFVLNLG